MELTHDPSRHVSGLIFFAVPQEAGPFRKAWIASGGKPWVRLGTLHCWISEGLKVCVTGMGQRNASRIAEEVLRESRPDWVVTAGFAGGLNPLCTLGEVGWDADTTFPSVARWVKAGAKPMTFHESTGVAVTTEAKIQLRRQTACDAVEMESATIRALCRSRGIPSATVRVISDTAQEDLPLDFGALMTPDDTLDFTKLAFTLMRSPVKIPQLIRFQGRVGRAAQSLAQVLVQATRA